MAGGDDPSLTALMSASTFATIMQGQWSLLLTASAMIPASGFVWAAKPSLGLALAIAYPSRTAFLGMHVLGVIAFALARLATVLDRQPQARCPRRANRKAGRLAAAGVVVALAATGGPNACGVCGYPKLAGSTTPYRCSSFLGPGGKVTSSPSSPRSAAVADTFVVTPEMDLVTALHRRWPLMLLLVYLPVLALVLSPWP